MNKMNADILIVGAGASGIFAAISAAEYCKKHGTCKKIVIMEKNDRIGRKILATGNGKCNLSNVDVSEKYYNKSASDTAPVLHKYDASFIREKFSSLGLLTKVDDEGRIYPYTERASSVLDVLRAALDEHGVQVITGATVNSVRTACGKFVVLSDTAEITANKVMFSVGGLASPAKTFANEVYTILEKLGLSKTEPMPALVAVKTGTGFEKSLKGVRWNSNVSLFSEKTKVCEESGEVQFTETGLSGICIFQLARRIGELKKEHKNSNLTINLDLMPDYEQPKIEKLINEKVVKWPKRGIEDLFMGILNDKLGRAVLKSAGVSFSSKLGRLTESEIQNIANKVKNLKFGVVELLPFKNAQIMAGGFKLSEIDLKKMESRKIKNLYLTGEMLDVDGLCGGFNLHWAWVSGYVAGENAAQ